MKTLNQRIGIAVILAILLGLIFRQYQSFQLVEFVTPILELIGEVFILLLKMIMVPLIFFSLTSSISSLKKNKSSQLLWKGAIFYYLSTMVVAVILMMVVMNLFQDNLGGSQVVLECNEPQSIFNSEETHTFKDSIKSLIKNPFEALSQGNIMAVVIFAIFFGIALRSDNEHVKKVKIWVDGVFEVVMNIVNSIMKVAPVGVFALLSLLIIQQELSMFYQIGFFIALVIGVISFHGVIFLPLLLKVFSNESIKGFWQGIKNVLITAFATSSSAATLPVTMSTLENDFKVNKKVSRFMLPLGATINMDGTALYEAAVALFVASMVGVNLGLYDQIFLVFLAMAASIGAPAIPSAGMVTLAIVLSALNLPVEYVAIFI
ncbi:MAG: dicarboxylate/amino acid:cation symporter, partial [Methylophilaceae bacterium]